MENVPGWLTTVVVLLVLIILPSLRVIGPTQVGLVMKRFGFRKLKDDNPIGFNGEAGFQADLLMPGLRFKLWILYKVGKFPWVQIPAGEIGVVIAQVGSPLPIGAKSAAFKPEFGSFTNLRSFIEAGGQKGVQRPVLPPGSLAPIHPVGFLIITKRDVYGVPISPEMRPTAESGGRLTPETFGLRPDQLDLVRIEPRPAGPGGKTTDAVGIVTTYEGDPLPSGDIATRLGGFSDVAEMEKGENTDTQIIEALLGSKNHLHNNYQDFQAFLDHGGKIGLQHDPLLYGAYALNPFLVGVEIVPMLVVEQGEVAVIKAYVGLVTKDMSGAEFKFGSLVRPGHRGIWQEALRTGKYPINPRCYQAEIVPTAILTLNWSETTSQAHNLDAGLSQITAKSREGFIFKFDLQVQIHVPDTKAPRVISMVGTMSNLVNEVLQAAVGNHFRDKLQSLPAVTFIETRQQVQNEAFEHISLKIAEYQVETKGVYIQDIQLPEALVAVLTQREIANQEIQTYQKQRSAQEQRIEMEQSKGTADMQAQLAQSKVNVEIETNNANAQKAKGEGEASYIRQTGTSRGAEVEAVGLARAKAFQAQVEALGQTPTAFVNAITVLAEKGIKLVPDTMVMGGGLGAIEGLAASLMSHFAAKGEHGQSAAADSGPLGEAEIPKGRQRPVQGRRRDADLATEEPKPADQPPAEPPKPEPTKPDQPEKAS
ncbi:MAG: SPFH domain-containing protein [Armatimonadetes bacterium]|nr:SPFH domain-containing protein [Armatimonadota bacterium]